ncbi:MAG: ABC transporter permease [Planctomycetes bacterium]|nr:ABC transporter permease [Planctomycetota bacterium]
MKNNSETRPAATPTPMARLWRRFLKARGAKCGLALIAIFGLAAFFAPFLAHRLPIFWLDTTGEIFFPLLREFLSPSDTTEPMLEKGINFLLVFLPLALLVWRLMNRWLPGLARLESRAVSLLFGVMFSATLWIALGGMVLEGAGKDWLYRESPPVPEIDDIRDARPVFSLTPPPSPAGWEAWAIVRQRLRELSPDAAAGTGIPEATGEEMRRRLIPAVQNLIEGSPLALPSAFSDKAGIDPLDITDANLDIGTNGPRWNRILFENAFPGFLAPMRQLRGAFLSLAAATFLVLSGLTYIFLAGANQFALSPRWLVLLLLAAVVVIPFRRPARHDHTPYRRLAAEGKGWGVFPFIPYGPNEQGFGPRLPPSWLDEPARLEADSIRSLAALVRNLESGPPAAKQVVAALSERLPDWREGADREGIAQALNQLIEGEALLYDADLHASLRGDFSIGPYLAEIQAGNTLAAIHHQRLNRLLLERSLPGAIDPASPSRWKKPRHLAGYHLLGTDESGRDVLVRVIHGARVSLSVGFVSVFLATIIGLVLGSLAAYYGGRVDMAISRFLEIMMCFPSFFLILAVIAVLDRRSIVNIMLVIGLTSWTGIARLIRGEMLRQKKMDYVSASIALGASDTRTIFRHILPNAMAPVLVSISFGITGAILTEAGLSFIGFGVTPPTPTWGQLLSETRDSPLANWWLAVFPGIVLFLSVVAYNITGEALRDALDPRTAL